MSRPRKAPPLPAPFSDKKLRHRLGDAADVCDATLQKWLMGDTTVEVNNCRAIVAACLHLGLVPPLGAKLPPPIGAEPAPSKHLQVVS